MLILVILVATRIQEMHDHIEVKMYNFLCTIPWFSSGIYFVFIFAETEHTG